MLTTTSTRAGKPLTRFLPEAYRGAINYVDVDGRTKIVVRGQITTTSPIRPSTASRHPRRAGGVLPPWATPRVRSPPRGDGERRSPSTPTFREPAPRLELMDEQGIDRTLMFPTLASLGREALPGTTPTACTR